MKFDIQQTAKDHRIVVAHRGVAGGNIPCNTMTAYETALKQGADMIETDLDFTADGKLVIFHPGMERNHLFLDKSIEQMPWEEVKKLRYVNNDNCYTQFGILTFDELLETFKGRCYINIDKFWGNPANIYKAIKAHDMVDQCLVKSGYSEEVIRAKSGVKNTRRKSFRNALFPPMLDMQLSYNAMFRHPWLYPVFWVARIFDIVIHRRKNIKKRLNIIRNMSDEKVLAHQNALAYMGLCYDGFDE